jgi:hypothetical protein
MLLIILARATQKFWALHVYNERRTSHRIYLALYQLIYESLTTVSPSIFSRYDTWQYSQSSFTLGGNRSYLEEG